MIIDCHCHAGKGDGLTGPWDTDASLVNYLRWATEYHIDKTVLFSAFHSNYTLANYEVAKIVNAKPNRFFGFAFLHAERDKGNIKKMVDKAIIDYGFVGLKVHKYDARISREICETALLHKIPILYDPMGEISTVELIAKEYPKVNFIIPHLSTFADDWKTQIAFISVLERYPNIYTDLSGVRRFDVIEEAVQRATWRKFLFGSDGPWLHPGIELQKIYELRISNSEKEMILSGNFLRLISK